MIGIQSIAYLGPFIYGLCILEWKILVIMNDAILQFIINIFTQTPLIFDIKIDMVDITWRQLINIRSYFWLDKLYVNINSLNNLKKIISQKYCCYFNQYEKNVIHIYCVCDICPSAQILYSDPKQNVHANSYIIIPFIFDRYYAIYKLHAHRIWIFWLRLPMITLY